MKLEVKRNIIINIGNLLYAIGTNLFLVPLGIYSGGLYGICQLIRTFLYQFIELPNIDIAGIIYFLFNIPLLIISYKIFDKKFAYTAVLSIFTLQMFLTFMPTNILMVDDVFTNIVIGSVLSGFGTGLVLKEGSCQGGLDIIGLINIKNKKNITIGKLSNIVNFFVYGICALVFNLQTSIYSIVSSFVKSYITDNTHEQIVPLTALVITKDINLKDLIMDNFKRGTTYFKATGGFTESKKYIIICTLSKHETQILYQICKQQDKKVFITLLKNEKVLGNFKSHLNYNETL